MISIIFKLSSFSSCAQLCTYLSNVSQTTFDIECKLHTQAITIYIKQMCNFLFLFLVRELLLYSLK